MFRVVIVFALIFSLSVSARMDKMPPSMNLNILDKNSMQTIELKAVDVQLLHKTSERKNDLTKPYQIATPNKVKITPKSDGSWRKIPGGLIWNIRFTSKGATDISFGFTKFNLPVGVELYLLSLDGIDSYYDGPYTSEDHRDHNQFWTAALPGGDVALELFVPTKEINDIELELTHVATGFRDIFKRYGGTGLNIKAGSCNNNVVCPVADEWRNEVRSVAHYSFIGSDNNSYVCTGSLVMDADRTFKPYFLTAAHCDPQPASVVTYWNYENMDCNDPVDGSTRGQVTQTISGSTLRAKRTDVDMELLELSSTPPESFNVHWSGWDRTGAIPNGSVGIHHPAGDEKVISFNDDPLTTVNSCIGSGGNNSHWQVDNWEDGTTEGGSSGSGLWDSTTHLLVGFLSGGLAACGNSEYDCYGKFSVAWTDGGSNPATKLQPWLDSNATGVNSVSGADSKNIFKDGFESF